MATPAVPQVRTGSRVWARPGPPYLGVQGEGGQARHSPAVKPQGQARHSPAVKRQSEAASEPSSTLMVKLKFIGYDTTQS